MLAKGDRVWLSKLRSEIFHKFLKYDKFIFQQNNHLTCSESLSRALRKAFLPELLKKHAAAIWFSEFLRFIQCFVLKWLMDAFKAGSSNYAYAYALLFGYVFCPQFYSFDKKNTNYSGFVQLFGPWCITQLFCIIRGRGPCWGFQYALWCSKRCLNFPNLLFNPLNEAKLLI